MNPVTNYIINIIGNLPETRRVIRDIVYFKNASENLLDLIINYGKIVSLRKNEIAVKQGDYDQWVYIILNGVLDVYLGDQKIDSTSATLIGERCILGESRKATLKAQNDGVILLGIDMAIIDALNKKTDKPTPEWEAGIRSCVELISSVTSVVYGRICQLWYYQVGKKQLMIKFHEAACIQQIILSLVYNKMQDDPGANDYLDFFLKEYMPEERDQFRSAEGTINTRKLVLFLQRSNRHMVFDTLIDAMTTRLTKVGTYQIKEKLNQIHLMDLDHISTECCNIFKEHVADRDRLSSEWKKLFFKEEEETLDLYRLICDIERQYSLTPADQPDIVFKILKVFAGCNDTINQNTRAIYDIQKSLHVKEVNPNQERDPLNVSVIGETLYSSYEEVEQYLVKPYLNSLKKQAPEQADIPDDNTSATSGAVSEAVTSAGSDDKKYSQADIDKLFG